METNLNLNRRRQKKKGRKRSRTRGHFDDIQDLQGKKKVSCKHCGEHLCVNVEVMKNHLESSCSKIFTVNIDYTPTKTPAPLINSEVIKQKYPSVKLRYFNNF